MTGIHNERFNDPEWDGEPVEPVEPPRTTGTPPGEPPEPPENGGDDPPPVQRIRIKLADGKERTIRHMAATTFWSPDGRPMSAADFIKQLFGELPGFFRDEDELRKLWGRPETRKALLEGLSEKGYGEDQLAEIAKIIDTTNSDLFDVLAYIAFALAPITRAERVDASRETILARHDEKLRGFLDFVLFQYVGQGVGELEPEKLPALIELKYHSVADAAEELGGIQAIRGAFMEFQRHLYDRH